MGSRGPLSKPAHLRRRVVATPGFTRLPHGGRPGEPPRWPLAVEPSAGEIERWAKMWSLPQTVMWERMRVEEFVARYVRTAIEAELPASDSKLLAEVRQMEDRLGLSPAAMIRLRWETDEAVREDEELDEPEPLRVFVPKTKS
jgi:hypothetical protein